ncbi:MAG: hypothetical protein A2089_04930 [Elusimicrobia bacterium GWD2_63_28]|nr:MAG: hypothetical protein A2089_04930 [Elusimicrobia bacterium GWD2_63_28]
MKKLNLLIALLAILVTASAAGAGEMQALFDSKPRAERISLRHMIEKNAPEVKTDALKVYTGKPKFSPEKQCFDVRRTSKDGAAPKFWANFGSVYGYETCARNSQGVEECKWETLSTHSARTEVTMRSRELWNGEAEDMQLCYNFVKKEATYSLSSPFEYEVKTTGLPGVQTGFALEFTPLYRKPAAPDAAILELREFSYDQARGEFTLKLDSSASSRYWGTRFQVSVELVQDRMFDFSKGTKVYEFPISYHAGSPVITFKESDFDSDKDAAGFRGKPKRFFVKWGFKVVGSPYHTDTLIEKGRTDILQVI